MKILIPIGILLLSVLGCTKKSASVEIAIAGDGGDSLLYVMRPHDGFTSGFTDTLSITRNGSVQVTFDPNDVTSVGIRNGNRFYRLIAEPGGTYNVLFDYTKNGITTCSDPAQAVYDSLFAKKNIYKYEFVRDYTAFPLDTVPAKMKANFEKLLSDDLTALQNVETSDRRRHLMEEDIRLFWLTSLAKVFRSNRNATPTYTGYMDTWGAIYKEHPVIDQLPGSSYLFDYASVWLTYMEGLQAFETTEAHWENQFSLISEHLNKKSIRESVFAQSLYRECLNNKEMNPAILAYIDQFKSEFPASGHIRILDPFVVSVNDFNERIKVGFGEGVKFVEDGDNISTFKELIAKFNGKPIFVDFWFSTCGPCLKQFAHNKPLHKFLGENGIEMLFVSIDRTPKGWENAIKYHQLKGWHARTSRTLHEDIYKNYGISLFPTYMLIDKNGNIVLEKAMEPEKKEALYQQIKTALE